MKTKRTDRATIRQESISFLATENEKIKIQKCADEFGITMSALVRMAVKEFIEKGAGS